MTFLITFFAIFAISALMPYVIRWTHKGKQRLKYGKTPVFVIYSMIPNYAFTTGIFGTNHIFLNASFGSWLTKDEKEISIYHEMGHVTMKHSERKTFINALFIAAFMQAVVYIPHWYWAGAVIGLYFAFKRGMNIMTTPLMHSFEYEADCYAATRSGYTAKIIKWYEKLAYSRQSATHPSIYDRMHKLTHRKL